MLCLGTLNNVTNEGLSRMLFEPQIPEIQAFRMRYHLTIYVSS